MRQTGSTLIRLGIADRTAQCLPFTDDDETKSGAGDGRIDDGTNEHDRMGTLQVHDDGFVLGTLGFVDRGSITEIQHSQLLVFILHDSSISEINHHCCLVFRAGDGTDIAHISVVDLLVVFDLHNLIAQAKAQLSENSLGFARSRRIYQGLQSSIHRIYGSVCLVTERCQKCYHHT